MASIRILLYFVICAMTTSFVSQAQTSKIMEADVIICGGTPAGIMAAVALDREGKSCIIVERTHHIGGLPSNGLGATDLKTLGSVGGLFQEFILRIDTYYKDTYGEGSPQHLLATDGYHFEPKVAEKVFLDMLTELPDIEVLYRHQFDALEKNVQLENNRINSIKVTNRETGEIVELKGKQFIDATYEGDLIAAAGVEFLVGRESKSEFNEPYAGKVYKYWEGPVGEGTTYEGDADIQAFNYRLCLTKNPEKRITITKPENYNREEYVGLIKDVITGRHAGYKYGEFKKKHPKKVLELEQSNGEVPPKVPGNPEGIRRLVNLTELPNDKSDANNEEVALISTDLPEENWFWPTGDWKSRDQFAKRLKDYTLGLLYFAQNDPELPTWFKDQISVWGLDNEEYEDNGYFPRQVYVREGRRMVGVYHFTAHDALPVAKNERPPLQATSISSGHYNVDSHGVRKREPNRVHLDGFVSYETMPFTIPYGVIVPKTVDNLLAPVPVSGTHLGFSAIRLEPTWMTLGEAAGVAAHLSIDSNKKVQDMNIIELQKSLLNEKAVLIYYKDMNPGDNGFEGMQLLGVNGIFDDWNAQPNKSVNSKTIKLVEDKFNIKLPVDKKKKLKRYELANLVYSSI